MRLNATERKGFFVLFAFLFFCFVVPLNSFFSLCFQISAATGVFALADCCMCVFRWPPNDPHRSFSYSLLLNRNSCYALIFFSSLCYLWPDAPWPHQPAPQSQRQTPNTKMTNNENITTKNHKTKATKACKSTAKAANGSHIAKMNKTQKRKKETKKSRTNTQIQNIK